MRGVVTKSTGSWYNVWADNGTTYACRIKGKFRTKGIKSTNPIAVGDYVHFELEDGDEHQGIINTIEDRKNYIVRKSVNLSKRVHIIAANMDQALLVTTLAEPSTSTGFMDRFLATAEAYRIPSIIVFNKCDLHSGALLEEWEYRKVLYEAVGYTCIETSATEGIGLEALSQLLKGKTTLLSGHSGVGKSTLINAIEPNLNLRTQEVSQVHGKGQHTTTFAEMFPLSFGGSIIDTPGIKGFGLVDMEKEEIGHYFPEIFKLSSACKYHNCLHVNEPQCAVKDALEAGGIAPTRYESYINFLNGTEDEETYRTDSYR